MKSLTLFNKLEILLYSTLISVMSGINHLKTQDQNISKSSVQPATEVSVDLAQTYDQLPERKVAVSWVSFQQSLLSLLMWVILGFAAGFLIGMINIG